MQTGIFWASKKYYDTDIFVLDYRYRIQSGRLGFDVDKKAEEFSLIFLSNSYVWDIPNKKLVFLDDLKNQDDFFVFLRRFCDRNRPSHEMYYHYPKNKKEIKEERHSILPYDIYENTQESKAALTELLNAYEFISVWDAQLNITIFTKNHDFVHKKISEEAKLLSIPLYHVNHDTMPVW